MTDTVMAETTNRIESITEQLEASDVSLEQATELKAAGDELLEKLEAVLGLRDCEGHSQEVY